MRRGEVFFIRETHFDVIKLLGVNTMSEGPHKELLDFVERAIKIEKQAVELYEDTAKTIDNAAVKLIIEELGMDSNKHAKMYQTIERVLKKQPYSFKDFHEEKWTDKLVAKRDLSKHIKIEERMIELLEEHLKIVKQPTIKAILEHVLEDEQRHHKILMQVIKGL
jgi:rubrerythrin